MTVTMSHKKNKKNMWKILERFDIQDCKPRATPCEQKLNYTDGAEMMSESEITEK